MREEMGLYRGKRLDNGEWAEGNLITSKNGAPDSDFAKILAKDKHGYSVAWHEVDMETIGQWTGLVDANGVKIFEGDIVKTNKFGEPNKTYIIKYDLRFGAFIGEDKYGLWFFTFDGDSDQFEVIGSIHDKAVEE